MDFRLLGSVRLPRIWLISVAATALFLPVSAQAQSGPLISSGGPTETVASVASPILRVGDRIKIVFYEQLENDEDRWRGRAGAIPRSFHQRAELSGEYLISEDGTLSLPMIGRVAAAGLTVDALTSGLSKPFEALIERRGFISVVGLERRPIYIVGPVKTPGVYKFEPGMTVLHAIALAGGVPEREPETWQRVEFGREVDRLQRALDRAKHLIVRTAILQAERDGSDIPRVEIAGLVGRTQLTPLVNEEAWQRNLTTMSRSAQEAALKTALSNARSEMFSRSERLAPIDATIAMRSERVKGMIGLADRNVIGRPVLIQAQSELSDAQERRNQILLEIEAARKRVGDAERELERFRLENSIEIGRAASSAKRDATETLEEGRGLLDVIKTLSQDRATQSSGQLDYEIVRKAATGTVILAATATTELEPGDLVRLRSPVPLPSSSYDASMPGGGLPAQPGSIPTKAESGPATRSRLHAEPQFPGSEIGQLQHTVSISGPNRPN